MRSSTLSWRVLVTGLCVATAAVAGPAMQKRTGPKCMDFKVPIKASAPTNPNITAPQNLGDDTVLIDFIVASATATAAVLLGEVGTVETSGTFTMAMRYCEPEKWVASRANTIHYMQHAITYNKDYWTGMSYPEGYQGDTYSYIEVASKNGYPTLVVDNLGSGGSDHPDPILVVQMSLQVEIIHQIITMLRTGSFPAGYWGLSGKKFDKVIYTGHSYGAICGNAIATYHPTDVDAFVLVGYSGQFLTGLVPLAAGIAIPAAVAMPARYSDLNPGYLAQSVPAGRQYGLYTVGNVGGFDPNIIPYDFAHEGTVAIGELATLFYGVNGADSYTGDIIVVTGKNDAIVCNQLLGANCGSGSNSIPAQAGAFFPNAKNYTTYIPDMTGHSTFMHYSSAKSYQVIHSYLSARGY